MFMPKPKQLHFQIERLYPQASTINAAANNINLTTGQSTQNLARVGRNNWKALRRMGANFGAMRFAYWHPTGIAPYDYFRDAILLVY